MRRMPGYCEKCYAVYETNGIVLEGINIDINFKNTVIGTCPTDGGVIRVVDGSYSLINGILTLKSYDKNNEIVDIMRDINLIALEQDYNELSRVLRSKNYDKNLVEKVLETIKEILMKTSDFQIATKIFFGLMVIITFGYDTYDTFNESDSDKNTGKLVELAEQESRDRQILIEEEKKQTAEEEKQTLEAYLTRIMLEEYLKESSNAKKYSEKHARNNR
ncbi:hypothetical protein ETI05_03415 [Macrococcoides canis]|nr:hypothetical protein ETI05_03415 [Macrococcus canis]